MELQSETKRVIQQKLTNEKENLDKYYIAFSFLAEISAIFKKNLYEFFEGDIQRAWNVQKSELLQLKCSIPRNFLAERNKIDPDALYEKIKKSDFKYISCADELYPTILLEIADYPLLLYYQGNIKECNFNKALAVVGSRKASDSAKVSLEGIISGFKNTDALIVSGLAYGIDATAHKSALENNIKTLGVIGSGLDTEYPSTNKELYRKIKEGGGVVMSEYPPGSPPVSHHFPARNRIVTGISYGTLVAEAALKSGAMISANLTLEQNRELMCMPGLISNPNTQGVYKLLKDGAHLITCAKDICDALGWEVCKNSPKDPLTEDEEVVLNIISCENSSVEKIQSECTFQTGHLMVVLTALELKGLIKQIRGKYFILG